MMNRTTCSAAACEAGSARAEELTTTGKLVGPPARVSPCFTPGTQIATQRGEIPAELLRQGDRVVTRDNGIQEVRWVGRSHMEAQDFAASPHLRPILIRQGSLGKNLPERDLIVSPDHRILIAREQTALFFSETEVLVAAKHLNTVGLQTIASSGTTYIHFMFDRHEVILSNGVWTESYQPEDRTLKGMGNAQRTEILELFPELKTSEGRKSYRPARRVLSGTDAASVVR